MESKKTKSKCNSMLNQNGIEDKLNKFFSRFDTEDRSTKLKNYRNDIYQQINCESNIIFKPEKFDRRCGMGNRTQLHSVCSPFPRCSHRPVRWGS